MSPQRADFQAEIEALDENFSQYYYAYQRDWLERYQINFQAIQALWDILNNVYDNLDDLNIRLAEITPALAIVEKMHETARDIQNMGEPTEEGIIFSGTREDYEAFGNSLLDKLYTLEANGAGFG